MKKLFFSLTTLLFIVAACNDNKEKTETGAETSKDSTDAARKMDDKAEKPTSADIIDLAKFAIVDPAVVERMGVDYLARVKANPTLAIKQINLNAAILRGLFGNPDTKGISFIPAYDAAASRIFVHVKFVRGDGTKSYHDFRAVFPSDQICPVDAVCEDSFPASRFGLSESVVKANADAYSTRMQNPSIQHRFIIQIRMSATQLNLMLRDMASLKLILAYDPALSARQNTVMMKFVTENDLTGYRNIKQHFFPGMEGMEGLDPVCPPPGGCDPTIIGMLK